MTAEQKKQIESLRLEGLGYKAIATLLNVSRDSVRSYCRQHQLNGVAMVVALNIKEKQAKNDNCAYCDKPLKQKLSGRTRKFCSDTCRRKWWLEHPEHRIRKEQAFYTYICSYCKKEFRVYGNKNRKYCSHHCYIEDRFWRGTECNLKS